LDVEVLVEVVWRVDKPTGELRCHADTFPIAVVERQTQHAFAVAAVVAKRRVIVVDAVIHSIAQHPNGFVCVDLPISGG